MAELNEAESTKDTKKTKKEKKMEEKAAKKAAKKAKKNHEAIFRPYGLRKVKESVLRVLDIQL